MKTIEDQLKELPEEFIIEMEQQKNDRNPAKCSLYSGFPFKRTL